MRRWLSLSALGGAEQIRETDSPHTRTHILCDKRFYMYIYIYTYIYIYIYTYVYVCGVTTVSVRGFESRPTRCSPGLGDSPRSPTDVPLWIRGYEKKTSLRVAKGDSHTHTHAHTHNSHRASVVGHGRPSSRHDTRLKQH